MLTTEPGGGTDVTARIIAQRLMNEEVLRVLNEPELKKRFLSEGIEPVGTTPEQTSAIIKADIAKWAKVIKEAGIREE